MFTALRLTLAAALLLGIYTALTVTAAEIVAKSVFVAPQGVAPPDAD